MISLVMPASLAGVKWTRETAYEEEGSSFCIEYGIYNPRDKDVNVDLSVTEDLQGFLDNNPGTILVNANTDDGNAVPVQLCFKTPKIYEEDCLISGILCEQSCDLDEVSYEGNVIATSSGAAGAGSGSGVSIAEAVPLQIRIKCNEHGRDYMPVYIAVLIIILIIIAIVYYKKMSPESQVIS